MGIMVSATSSAKKKDPIEPGVYQAVCINVYDLGTQYNEQWDSSSRKVRISWELPDVREVLDDGDFPRIIGKEYTLSLGDRANLKKDLESWRGRPFTGLELSGFELTDLLGKNCMLNITNGVSKLGNAYSAISGIMPLIKSMKSKESEYPLDWFSVVQSTDIPESVPNWIAEIMQSSAEYQKAMAAGSVSASGNNDDTDSVPF